MVTVISLSYSALQLFFMVLLKQLYFLHSLLTNICMQNKSLFSFSLVDTSLEHFMKLTEIISVN